MSKSTTPCWENTRAICSGDKAQGYFGLPISCQGHYRRKLVGKENSIK